METVFRLCHEIEYINEENADWKKEYNSRILGVYSTKEKAEEALKLYKTLPGFKDTHDDCFCIGEYNLNKRQNGDWLEGFVTMIYEDFKSKEELIEYLNHGEKAGFDYNDTNYFIYLEKGKTVVEKLNDYKNRKFYDSPIEALNYEINGKKIVDILPDMPVVTRIYIKELDGVLC